jgi:hypothetical protein
MILLPRTSQLTVADFSAIPVPPSDPSLTVCEEKKETLL